MFENCVLPSLIALMVAFILTPIAIRLAPKLGLVDAPDGFRKLHGRTVALGGGVAVMLSTMFAVAVAMMMRLPWAISVWDQPLVVVGCGIGAILICVIGLFDDWLSLRGRQKFVGQVAAALVAVSGGVVISKIDLFGTEIHLGLLSVPFTLFWLLGAVNALNLIDGVDGLATSVGILQSISISVLASLMGNTGEAAIAAILAGALVGFLPYNWSPARIFLGDAGSMFIGFSLGILAILGSFKGPATVALIAPTAIWAIPIFDVGIAILRRKLTGQSLYTTDRGHLHHVLQRYGLGHIGTVLVIATMSLLCGIGALVSVLLKNELMAIVVCVSIYSFLVLSQSFGYSECGLLWRRCSTWLGSCLRLPRLPIRNEVHSSRFYGNREFEKAWESLVLFAERYDLSKLIFNINAPMLGEVFHASWQRREPDPIGLPWHTEIPLTWGQFEVGRVKVLGIVPQDTSPFLWTSDLMHSLKPFETQVVSILESPNPPPASNETIDAKSL